jgi:SHS2 domain-containing protein
MKAVSATIQQRLTDGGLRCTEILARGVPDMTVVEPVRASSELLAHTAEVRLRVRGPTLASLAAEAGRALARVELGGAARPRGARGAWRDVRVESRDSAALLVDWLNELIYLAETLHWVPLEFELETTDASDGLALTGRARGVAVAQAPARVKAATFHGLHVTPIPGGLEAEIVLDV